MINAVYDEAISRVIQKLLDDWQAMLYLLSEAYPEMVVH